MEDKHGLWGSASIFRELSLFRFMSPLFAGCDVSNKVIPSTVLPDLPLACQQKHRSPLPLPGEANHGHRFRPGLFRNFRREKLQSSGTGAVDCLRCCFRICAVSWFRSKTTTDKTRLF